MNADTIKKDEWLLGIINNFQDQKQTESSYYSNQKYQNVIILFPHIIICHSGKLGWTH